MRIKYRHEVRGLRTAVGRSVCRAAGLAQPSVLSPQSSIFNPQSLKERGFTLVEMIVVIVITGIIYGMVAVFLKAPVQQYVDVARRADMTDTADTALRRIGRDVRLALPNSVRVSPDGRFIEFLPTKGGGRYRADVGSVTAGCGSLALDVLDFAAADTCLEVLGRMPPVAINDEIVVYNLGIPGADAYAGFTLATHNRRVVSAAGAATISITSANALPFDSPGNRFHVVTTPVSYVCDGTTSTLWRYSGYAIQAAQPSTVAALNGLANVQSAKLANNASCSFTYDALVAASQRAGLVTMSLAITEGGETVNLYGATHVSNVP